MVWVVVGAFRRGSWVIIEPFGAQDFVGSLSSLYRDKVGFGPEIVRLLGVGTRRIVGRGL